MNIIRQAGASIGTAILSVLLATAIHRQPLPRSAACPPVAKAASGALHGLTAAQQARVAEPAAEAFASTFVWALALLALAFIPALAMALGSRGEPRPGTTPQVAVE